MEFDKLLGKKLEQVLDYFHNLDKEVIVIDNSSYVKDFDTQLVVRIKELENSKIEIVTSKFKIEVK